MTDLTCAIVTPVGPGHEKLVGQAQASVESAIAHGKGPFSRIAFHPVNDTEGMLGRSAARNRAVAEAAGTGFDWIFFLDADDILLPSAFEDVTRAVESHDAIWGAIAVLEKGSNRVTLRQPQYMIESVRQLAVLPPIATLQMGHFVKTPVAFRHKFEVSRNVGEDLDYYLRVWESERCVKLSRPLFVNRRGFHSTGPRSATGMDWTHAVRAIQFSYREKAGIDDDESQRIMQTETARASRFLLDQLVSNGVLVRDDDGDAVASYTVEGVPVRFVVDNPMDIIQSHFLRASFFEYDELRMLRSHVASGARILEVGANVGNHLVYYTKMMGASLVIPIEPNPTAIRILRKNILLNGIGASVRGDFLGIGVGEKRGTFTVGDSPLNNLGATRLVPSTNGDVKVVPIDDLQIGKIDFIKIDVEGMELGVLRGAERTIRSYRPIVYVEVMNHNRQDFSSVLDEHGYQIGAEFRCVNATNYLIRPT